MSQSACNQTKKREGDAIMTRGFQQQDTGLGFCFPKSTATPQHGQPADKTKAQPPRPPRVVERKPGH